ncbi:response regulator transcription factor [Aridibaculum aurantiacum]|uniref:response regulator transcription factor n=1 Tax=Aridibaculum aurantiacum TaxID=2810307 RepID=UPI001A96692D|nr:response regulator transcription factor [Aridibaculum aurantiacum]
MEAEKIRLLIADDHEVYRDGLKLLLRKAKEIEVVGEAEDGIELISMAGKLQPDVILTDIKMPRMDGVTATKNLLDNGNKAAVVALSMFDEDSLIVDMIEAGAKGYLLKNADKKEIIEAIKTVHTGEPYYCKDANLRLSKLVLKLKSKQEPPPVVEFTEKEMEVIALICQEKNNKEIGDILFVSHRTVERYKLTLMEKMNVKSLGGIIIYAIKNGLYHIDS